MGMASRLLSSSNTGRNIKNDPDWVPGPREGGCLEKSLYIYTHTHNDDAVKPV